MNDEQEIHFFGVQEVSPPMMAAVSRRPGAPAAPGGEQRAGAPEPTCAPRSPPPHPVSSPP